MNKEVIMDPATINVRWLDGLLESFQAIDVRLGGGLLYFELSIPKTNRHIPLCNVRWFSVNPPTREVLGK